MHSTPKAKMISQPVEMGFKMGDRTFFWFSPEPHPPRPKSNHYSHTQPPFVVIVITIYAQLVYVNFFPIDELNSDSCKHTKKCRYFYVLSLRGKGFFFEGGGTLNPSTRSYASEKYFYIWCLNLNLEEIYTDKQSYDRLNPLIQAESFSYYKFQLILCVL